MRPKASRIADLLGRCNRISNCSNISDDNTLTQSAIAANDFAPAQVAAGARTSNDDHR
jgi:hypothetical protein